MKVFVQAENESIIINDDIIVTVLEIHGDEVILKIDAPEWMELCEKEGRDETLLVRPR